MRRANSVRGNPPRRKNCQVMARYGPSALATFTKNFLGALMNCDAQKLTEKFRTAKFLNAEKVGAEIFLIRFNFKNKVAPKKPAPTAPFFENTLEPPDLDLSPRTRVQINLPPESSGLKPKNAKCHFLGSRDPKK